MDPDIAIRTGDSFVGGYFNLAGSFLIFNGGIIEKSALNDWKYQSEQFEEYDSNIQPKKINFPLIMNFTENINIALEQASNVNVGFGKIPVLIVMSI